MHLGILDAFRGNKGENLEKLENRDLLNAIDALAHSDSAETRDRVYRTLLNVILLIPVAEIPTGFVPGENITHTRTPLRFPLIRDARGNKVVPIFSDLEALRNWDPNALYVGLKSIDIFKIVMATDADEITINPFDPARKMIRPGGTLTRREFQPLAEGRIPEAEGRARVTLQPGQRFLIGVPAEQPDQEIVERLVSTAGSIRSINALFLFQIGWQQNEKWNFQRLIGIQSLEELDAPQKGEIIRQLAQSIQSLPTSESLDFMVLEDVWEQQIVANGKLLYEISG